jgi:hypothetical protein
MQKSKWAFSLLFLFFTSIVSAEDMTYLLQSSPGQRAESQTRFMKTKLDLSDDVAIKVEAINLEYAEKVEPVLKGSSLALIKKHDIEGIQEQKDNALRLVLTAQQFDIYVNSKDELKQALKQDLSH